jgi:hypothetical protein
MHVEAMEPHDGVMFAECCLSDVVALIALGFSVCFVIKMIGPSGSIFSKSTAYSGEY